MIDEKKLNRDDLCDICRSADCADCFSDKDFEKWIDMQPKLNTWIPVSDGLPEEYESVLFSTLFGGVKFGYITSYREWKDEAEGYTYCDDEVSAWMPLPEPYKECNDDI